MKKLAMWIPEKPSSKSLREAYLEHLRNTMKVGVAKAGQERK